MYVTHVYVSTWLYAWLCACMQCFCVIMYVCVYVCSLWYNLITSVGIPNNFCSNNLSIFWHMCTTSCNTYNNNKFIKSSIHLSVRPSVYPSIHPPSTHLLKTNICWFVICITILKDGSKVLNTLLSRCVLVLFQFLLYVSKIHWTLNYIEIVLNLQQILLHWMCFIYIYIVQVE